MGKSTSSPARCEGPTAPRPSSPVSPRVFSTARTPRSRQHGGSVGEEGTAWVRCTGGDNEDDELRQQWILPAVGGCCCLTTTAQQIQGIGRASKSAAPAEIDLPRTNAGWGTRRQGLEPRLMISCKCIWLRN
uniref:Uncharacterized protein n=1 Tax=Setaria viridis TaxID=4556 RepID=A0A4V6DA15_SETVI|nr:hypothetical protein SEVIR_3G296200v2 [Setaria viridis]